MNCWRSALVSKNSFYCGSLVHCESNPRLHLPLFRSSASTGWENTTTILKPEQTPTLFLSGHSQQGIFKKKIKL